MTLPAYLSGLLVAFSSFPSNWSSSLSFGLSRSRLLQMENMNNWYGLMSLVMTEADWETSSKPAAGEERLLFQVGLMLQKCD